MLIDGAGATWGQAIFVGLPGHGLRVGLGTVEVRYLCIGNTTHRECLGMMGYITKEKAKRSFPTE